MNLSLYLRVMVFVPALLVLTENFARAEYVQARLDYTSPGLFVKYKVNGTSYAADAGINNWTRLAGGSDLGATFATFCIEATKMVTPTNVYEFDTQPILGYLTSTQISLLSELWGTYRSQVIGDTTAAAFQFAIWEIVHDTGLNVLAYGGPGNTGFKADYSSTSLPSQLYWLNVAQQWLDSLGKGNPAHSFADNLIVLNSDTAQDQLGTAPTAAVVPVPPGAVMLLLGGLGLVIPAWKRRGN